MENIISWFSENWVIIIAPLSGTIAYVGIKIIKSAIIDHVKKVIDKSKEKVDIVEERMLAVISSFKQVIEAQIEAQKFNLSNPALNKEKKEIIQNVISSLEKSLEGFELLSKLISPDEIEKIGETLLNDVQEKVKKSFVSTVNGK